MKLSTPHGHDFFHHWQGLFHDRFFWGHRLYDEIGIHRGWLAALGILYILLGMVGFGLATLMTLASVMVFGALAVAGGIVQLGLSFTSRGTRNVAVGAALGALYLIAGLLMLGNPLASSLLLAIFLAAALIALGVARIAFWFRHRTHRYWIWSVISGVVSMLVGALIVAQWPLSGLWVIGLFVSLEMIFHGTAAVGLAMEKAPML